MRKLITGLAALAVGLTSAAPPHPGNPGPAGSPGNLPLAPGCLSAADIYEQVRPAVVEITSTSSGRTPFGPQAQGMGSGVVIDDQGTILTNEHVIAGADSLEVKFADGTTLPAQALGSDPGDDLAVVRVEGAGPRPAARLAGGFGSASRGRSGSRHREPVQPGGDADGGDRQRHRPHV